MAVDITINETIDSVDITVNPNIINVNVTRTSGGGGIQSIVAGTNITVDDSDPQNPIVSATGSAGVPTLQQVTDEGNTTTNDIIVSKETGASYIQVASNNNILTLQVDAVNGTYIELNDPDTNRYGYIYSGGLAFEEIGYSNINLRDGFLTISNAAIKPYIYLQGSDDTLTGSVTIKTDLVDDDYTQQLPPKDGTFAFLDDVPTKTSDLINDGDNGTSHFITLEDLPSNLILYPTTVASGIGGYNKLVSSITDPDYNTTAVDVSTGAITGIDQLIAGLITSPNIIVGNPGIFNITTIGNIRKVSGAGQAEFYFRVYKRDVSGTETLILQSSNTPQITSAIYTEFSATGLWNDGVFISTDMIVMKFYGTKVGSGSSPTYDFQFGGTQPVRTLVPIPLTVVPNLSLDELTDVTISAATNNQVLAYTSATDIWENKTIIQDSITDGVTTVAPSQNAVFDALALKTDKTDLVDYSATSTIIGWSSFTQKKIFYKILDDVMIVYFNLEGTSNASNISFTIPQNASEFSFLLSAYIINNGLASNNPGRIGSASGSNVVTIQRDGQNTAFTASGVKRCSGQILIQI